MRDEDGSFTTFDPPGSVFTSPRSINEEGEITGTYVDAIDVFHGFVREKLAEDDDEGDDEGDDDDDDEDRGRGRRHDGDDDD